MVNIAILILTAVILHLTQVELVFTAFEFYRSIEVEYRISIRKVQ